MIIHIHSTLVPNSGELKRMKNIDFFVTKLLETKSVEVTTYNYGRHKEIKTYGKFVLSKNVYRKYYVPLFPIISRLIMNLFYVFLAIRYQPTCIIGEMVIPYNNLWLIKKLFPKIKIVFDVHGALAEEADYQGKGEDVVNRYRILEQKEINNVHYLICQSNEMKKYLVDKYGADPHKICIFRCGVDTSIFNINEAARIKIRQELIIDDNVTLFCYSGGLHPWQRVDDSLTIFERYHRGNPNSKMLVLTGDRNGLQKLLYELKIDNKDNHIISKTLPFDQVSNYLNACDVAFLLRHNHAMNAVASPTKLAEYMSCGLPVITSDVAKNWVDKEGEGYFIMEDKADNCKYVDEKLNMIKRNAVCSYSARYFSLEVDSKELTESVHFFN